MSFLTTEHAKEHIADFKKNEISFEEILEGYEQGGEYSWYIQDHLPEFINWRELLIWKAKSEEKCYLFYGA